MDSSRAPHSPQNFTAAGLSCWQRGQFTLASRLANLWPGVETSFKCRVLVLLRQRALQVKQALDVRCEKSVDDCYCSVETSLKFLQTDFVDSIQIHSLITRDDLERIASASGVLAAIRELKEQMVARFIGITGDNHGAAMAEVLRRYNFDTVLMALNAAQSANPIAQLKMEPIPAFEGAALPVALQKNLGILSMKVMGQGACRRAGAKRARRHGFHPDQRIRQAKAARKSCAVALSLGEFPAHAGGFDSSLRSMSQLSETMRLVAPEEVWAPIDCGNLF
jgi:aryl-alcohol dehydrogenase-like predicted oxidoreductase